MAFIIKISNQKNVDAILNKQQFTHDGIYNFKDEIMKGDVVFLYLGGDKSKISWSQGLVGYGIISEPPYDVGYDGKRNFKIDVAPELVLKQPIPPKETKLHKKYQNELYDVPYVGANHFPNQAIAKVQEAGEQALFSILIETPEGHGLIEKSMTLQNNHKTPPPSSTSLPLPKPFILLAGISGTGKTRFVREQAKSTSQGQQNYEIVPVRPDWHEPSDLLGYISRLGKQPEYVPTKVLSFIAQAWAHLNPTVELDDSGRAWWSIPNADNICPYWLCLDEMNLAPVEQYFADYLSVLETREFDHSAKTLKYRSDTLVAPELIKTLDDAAQDSLRRALDVSDELFSQFKEYGIPLPFNLILAGTVNMDETTHGFSRKVIDRAFTIDFGLFFENRFDEFFKNQPNIQPLTFSTVADAREPGLFDGKEALQEHSVKFLTEVNNVLKGTPFELAFRALNELLLSVHCFNPKKPEELAAVWDDFLMTKVLPRIEGDSDKLSLPDADNASTDNNVLSALESVLKKHPDFDQIIASERTDFFRTDSNGDAKQVPCRSLNAIKRMKTRLETNGYTSFWP